MKDIPLYDDEAAETAFRTWQNTYRACLTTNWKVSNSPLSLDRFSLERYTGRSNFKLMAN